MIWVCSSVFTLMALVGRILCGNWVNLLTVFAGYYAVTITFANLGLYGISLANDKACLVLMIGILFFSIGFILIKITSKRRNFEVVGVTATQYMNHKKDSVIPDNSSVRTKVVIAMFIFVIVYTLYRLYWTMDLLSSGYSMDVIRTI